MSDADDELGLTVNDVVAKVWPGDQPKWQGTDWLRRALVRAAVEITHECGTEEASLRAYAHTVESFLRYESSSRCRRFERERDEARAYAVALADGLKDLRTPYPVDLCREDRERIERYRKSLLRSRDE